MKYGDADYVVKGRQLEKLEEELEKVEEFCKLVADSDASFDSTCEQCYQALRELKYLVEDIGGQEMQVCGG